MKKYENEQGQTGVIVSSGSGAGWSTSNDHEEFFAMDKTLVEMKLNGTSGDDVKEYCKKTNGTSPCMYGWSDARVVWVEKGTRFTIKEFNGSESLLTNDDLSFTA